MDDDEPTLELETPKSETIVRLLSDTDGTVLEAYCNDSITIGRKGGCDIQIVGDKSVSGVHCRIIKRGENVFYVRDESSSNGTYLNDRKISEEEIITGGDTIEIGRTRYTFSVYY